MNTSEEVFPCLKASSKILFYSYPKAMIPISTVSGAYFFVTKTSWLVTDFIGVFSKEKAYVPSNPNTLSPSAYYIKLIHTVILSGIFVILAVKEV